MTPKELREKSAADVNAFIEKWQLELAGLKVQASIGQCQKTAQIPVLKRDIARAKTILNERNKQHG